jgi:acetate kinase
MITEKRFKDERLIAYSAIDKIKTAATVIPSDNPKHKNSVKYMISKKEYHAIIETVFDNKCARHMNRESIRSFIDTQLKKL